MQGPRRGWRHRAAVLIGALAGGLAGCANDGFTCGEPSSPGSDTIRKCSGTGELCICATGSCARKEHAPPAEQTGGAGAADPPDHGDSCAEQRKKGACDPPYRYLSEPFAARQWACECVPASHLEEQVVKAGAENARCGGTGGSGGQASGTGGTTTSSTTSSGGMGGGGGTPTASTTSTTTETAMGGGGAAGGAR